RSRDRANRGRAIRSEHGSQLRAGDGGQPESPLDFWRAGHHVHHDWTFQPMKLANPRRDGERGFVLPGVVMFVIVLTILGLSLFALSSYEAQFMNATLDQTQAFYFANGAIDRARYLLTSTYRLQDVASNLGAGVDSAIAIQDPYGNPNSAGDWRQNTTTPM